MKLRQRQTCGRSVQLYLVFRSYAKIILNLMGDNQSYYYIAICKMYSLTETTYSSWNWTLLTLGNGVSSVEVTEETCRKEMEAAYFPGTTGFDPLPLAIEATTQILGGVDGYSKLINYNSFHSGFSLLNLVSRTAVSTR
jgi:hypothetical protein